MELPLKLVSLTESTFQVVDDLNRVIYSGTDYNWADDIVQSANAIYTSNQVLFEECQNLAKKNLILEKKNSISLANNLCPDHRDKQVGKPCLACTIESLEKRKQSGAAWDYRGIQ